MAKGIQILTEEEERIYLPNKKLQLTDKAEIQRLRKVIEEKDALITKFKQYDEQRKVYCERLKKNNELIEERFKELASAVDDCEDIDDSTKEYYKNIIDRFQMFSSQMVTHRDKTKVKGSLNKIQRLAGYVNDMDLIINDIDQEKRDELKFVLNKMRLECEKTSALLEKLIIAFNID